MFLFDVLMRISDEDVFVCDRYGYHEECLERSICEIARHPIHRHEDDVISEALHVLLT